MVVRGPPQSAVPFPAKSLLRPFQRVSDGGVRRGVTAVAAAAAAVDIDNVQPPAAFHFAARRGFQARKRREKTESIKTRNKRTRVTRNNVLCPRVARSARARTI